MGSQIERLLLEVSRQVAATAATMDSVNRRQEELAREHGIMRERISALEKDEKWSGEERRNVAHRLESGDHTFQKLQSEVKTSSKDIESAVRRVKQLELDLSNRTENEKKIRWDLLQVAITTGLGIAGFFLAKLFEMWLIAPKGKVGP